MCVFVSLYSFVKIFSFHLAGRYTVSRIKVTLLGDKSQQDTFHIPFVQQQSAAVCVAAPYAGPLPDVLSSSLSSLLGTASISRSLKKAF